MLAAGIVLLAFTTTGGVDLAPNTWAEIALLALAAGLAVALILRGPAGRPWGAVTLVLLAALTALSALSITWSVQPDNSWVETNRSVSYLAAFAGAIALVRLIPGRWRGVIGAVAAATTLLSAYALLVKVFPGTFDATDPVGRIKAPFDYWNATGLMAAMGLPACLWCGARREGSAVARALTVPAVAILLTALILSYSRSALAAAIVGLGLWFALVPLRLRAALILGLGSVGGGVLTIWALATHPLTHDRSALAARTTAGHSFGLLLVLVLVVLALAGFAAAFAMDRATPSPQVRRRIGVVLIGLVTLAPVAGVGALASSSRGLTGEISHVWSSLTNPNNTVNDAPSRLVELGNSRPRYWGEGLKVGEHQLLHGVGAAGYGTARTRYTNDPWIVEHAHSYLIETFADLGLLGIAVSLALLLAWGLATARTLLWRGARRSPMPKVPAEALTPERAGLTTLLAVVVVFGVHSSIDWTWFVPGTAIPALLCAGWLAGRGPLNQRLGPWQARAALLDAPGRAAGVVAIAAVAVLVAWTLWQPLRAADADAAAINAMNRGDAKAAFAEVRAAAAADPVSVEPLWELSAIYSATGNEQAAHTELVKAISLQPENPATWRELGFYDLQHRRPHKAAGLLLHSLKLAPRDEPTIQALQQAQAEVQRERAR